ncbi:ROK family protein [Shimia marina]|uniref:Fructokinase n=1 Tax=Shimia marina TaxID=321267 RepID=A0A0N7LRP8_9RHOB|nr:ROK family protein [Shimia marina]CUH51420.1 Fructokinase [Shimia marina]SFD49652.1 N-acetylglucosamine kinase [Shimia marina]
MTAAGIDLGGTKCEVRLFDEAWTEVARHRTATPQTYGALVQTVAGQVAWAEAQCGSKLPVGIGAAGLINPHTGITLTANLPATGRAFPSDINAACGRAITYVNDSHAMALSEAVFGAGQGHDTVISLILGTGIGGGVVVKQSLISGPTATGGEVGHTAAPAHLIAQHNLPVYPCGCGRQGCIETYISGPGMARLAKTLTGKDVTPQEIAARRHGDMAEVWALWCALTAELLHSLTLMVDPNLIILGGGLSQINGVIPALSKAAQTAQIGDLPAAHLTLAQGGDSSGARGAAYAAWQEANT